MFEKEAEEAIMKKYPSSVQGYKNLIKNWQDGATFGYNKANEWHYVKDEGTPKVEGHYLVCLRDKCHSILDCWVLFDKDIGWYSLQARLVDIYAWKEIVLPELKESE